MTTAYYSTVLNHPLETVWDLIRDFNNYPAYIEGVSESMIEDDRGGDEVGAVRRFCYLGNWIRQRLAGHSDEAHTLTYAGIEPLPFPAAATPDAPAPTHYEGRCTCCRSSRATGPSSNGKFGSIPRRRMPIAGRRCFNHGFRTGRIRSREHWVAFAREE
ncbi:SRPBCC family protein [Bradyrhizobium sp. AZCC 1693]|uniref:SRPBCC family protein n=1 Tax=Bradyrhizobium sp. AZCC 1693 TaxID=3117029 RepID=UPI002FEE888C